MKVLKQAKRGAKWFVSALKTVFGVRREERFFALVMLLLIVGMNALVLAHYHDEFTKTVKYYWPLFIHGFHISGFDPITYSVVSDWTAGYNVYRHPLLAFFMYPLYLVNVALMWLTGYNCAIYLVASMQIFCAFYALLFFRRILRDIIQIDGRSSSLLALLLFSFAYVMLSAIVPDHFIISMMLLLLTLWVSGRWIKGRRRMTIWHTWLLFTLTAGVSLNNGLKTFLASLFVNRWRFFQPKHFFLAVILPSALIWGASRWSYANIVWPRDMARNEAKAKKKAAKERKEREKKEAQRRADSIAIARGDTVFLAIKETLSAQQATTSDQQKKPKKKTKKHVRQGKPISNGEFLRWTDITTSRSQSIVENLFGESIQLHDQHLLEDEFNKRPMIVPYSWTFNYVIEAVLVIFFIVGVWCGRHYRLLWLALSWFGLDLLLHVGLGFGLNEVYIMSAHWIFVMPLAMAFGVKKVPPRHRRWVDMAVAMTAFYLLIYNITLIVTYLY